MNMLEISFGSVDLISFTNMFGCQMSTSKPHRQIISAIKPHSPQMMDTSLWFLFISLGISLIYSLYKLFPFSQNARLPPGPAKLPIVGNLFDLDQNRLHVSLANLAKSYGPIMSLKLGLTTTIVISSPEAAQDVLQTKDVFFSARSIPDAFYAYNFNNRSVLWLPSTSPLWKQLRATCSMYLFSPRFLEFTRQMREKKAQDIMQHFRRLANHPVDIGPVVFAGMLNIISNLVFSEDVVDLNSESKQEFKDLITSSVHESIKPNISDLFPFLRLLDLQGRRRGLTGYLERFYNFFDDVIDHRVKCVNVGGKRNNDFLDSLLKLNAESKLDRQTMKVLLTTLITESTPESDVSAGSIRRKSGLRPNRAGIAEFWNHFFLNVKITHSSTLFCRLQ
ncbi:hypothetical protein LUZ60_002809 [Juncus effusus]|nr:hypothetical protein LUZ60_002809 [Juncus effusus]